MSVSSRYVCVSPCPPAPPLGVNIPFGGFMQASATISLKGSCGNCEAVSSMMLQIQPLFAALGIPLCLIGCAAALVGVMISLSDVMTSLPAPDIGAILEAIQKVVTSCACVLQLVDPTGICAFVRMIRDFLLMGISIIGCVEGLLAHLLTLHLKVTDLRLKAVNNPSVSLSFSETAECLENYTSVTQQNVLAKFNVIKVVFSLLEAVFTFIEAVIPIPDEYKFTSILAVFDAFEETVSSPDVIPSEVIQTLGLLKNALEFVYDGLGVLPGCTS